MGGCDINFRSLVNSGGYKVKMNNQEGDWCTKRHLLACSTLAALYYAVDHSVLLQFIYFTFASPGSH